MPFNYLLVDVHFDAVSVASTESPIDPDEHDVAAIRAFDRREREDSQAGQNDRGLGQVLPSDSTFSWLANNDRAKGGRPEAVGEPQKSVQLNSWFFG